jgi:hypothetical protein
MKCTKCNFEGDENHFVKVKGKSYHHCKKCRQEYINLYRRQRTSGEREKITPVVKDGKKKCKTCSETKLLDEFPKRNTSHGYRNECKKCKQEKLNDYYQRVYNEKRRERKKNDPLYKLKANHRLYLHKCVHQFKMVKTGKSIEYLGCSIFLLKKWLEFQFDDKMNWDNYGTYWTIDHVLPLSKFNLVDEKEHIAFHWTNLRPCTDNFNKSDKILLHEYFNTIISAIRFQRLRNITIGYQNIKETLCWLREKHSGMVKIPHMNKNK